MILLLLLLLLLLTSCKETPPQPEVFAGTAMTMPYRILIGHPLDEGRKKKLNDTIQRIFAEIDFTYNRYNPNSEISAINRMPKNHPVTLSPGLEKLLLLTQRIFHESGGRFDPTVFPLQEVWKKHLEKEMTPPDEKIAAILPAIGWNNISISNHQILKRENETAIDLGGIAKGYAVDLLLEEIQNAGYSHIYVEWGGEIRAAGKHPQGRDWQIYISRMTDTDPTNAIAHLSISDRAIATSGDYLQYWQVGEKTYSHIIDPRTKSPIHSQKNSIASVSVVAPTCATADALATTLMLFPNASEAKAWAHSLQDKYPSFEYWIIER